MTKDTHRIRSIETSNSFTYSPESHREEIRRALAEPVELQNLKNAILCDYCVSATHCAGKDNNGLIICSTCVERFAEEGI